MTATMLDEVGFLEHLSERGFVVAATGDSLSCITLGKDRLTAAERAEIHRRKPALLAYLGDRPLPLSFAQERLWMLARLEADAGCHYNAPIALRLIGELDIAALTQAFRCLIRRHASLRTIFPDDDGVPRQQVLADLPFDLQPEPIAEADLRPRLATAARHIFSLAEGPLLRVHLMRLKERPDEHVLMVNQHHIITDAWSAAVMVQELGVIYNALRRGEPRPPLPELPLTYADFAIWQRLQMSDDRRQQHLTYWRRQLDGYRDLELPGDRPRPAEALFSGDDHAFSLAAATIAKLTSLAGEVGATLFMTFVAAWQLLLGRWAGQDDLVIGAPIANRQRRELAGLIGFFTNTLPLRGQLSGAPTFRVLLEKTRRACLDAYAHQDLPFEVLVEHLGVPRDLSRSPIFQVLLVVENASEQPNLELDGLAVEPLAIDFEIAKFDLTLSLRERHDGVWSANLEYSDHLFAATTARRLARAFTRLLDGIAADADRPIIDYELLAAADRQQLLREWSGVEATRPGDESVFGLFAAQARRTPDEIALLLDERHLTYADLHRQASALAHQLHLLYRRRTGRELHGDVAIAICLERGPEMLVALLAVLAAGGAYAPLDPGHPTERLRLLLDEIRPPLIITHRDIATELQDVDAERVLVEDLPSGESHHDEALPAVAPGALAYVIYTSGSTGRPKGVMLRNASLVNRLRWMWGAFPMGPGNVFLFKSPYVFDWSFAEIFLPLTRGAALAIAAPEEHKDPQALIERIEAARVDHLHFVPSMFAVFLEAAASLGATARCASLRRLFTSGEALTPAMRRQFHELFADAELHNLYGPTEVGEVSHEPCRGSRRYHCAIEPIGRAIANGKYHILDRQLRPVPIGVPGELWLGGLVLARGYYRRPALTADRFLPDPFADRGGERLYRSGDLVRWYADGNVEFLGRLDFQVKIRGQRIEPSEIEARLEGHPEVARSLVLALEPAGGDRYLACYWTAEVATAEEPPTAVPPTADELRAFLADRLPSAMVPEAFVRLDSFPLTANGKVDRRRLPLPQLDATAASGRAPRDATERRLLQLLREVLANDAVDIDDDFFAAGGHSLLAARWVVRINRAFGTRYPVSWAFRWPTVAAQAAEMRRGTNVSAYEPVVRFNVDGNGDVSGDDASPPLWLIHPADAGAEAYGDLITRLGNHQINVIESHNLYSGEAVIDDPMALAERYWRFLRAEQTCGPYRLGGWSLGGALAYELAQRLRRAGEEVQDVYLFDTIAVAPSFDWRPGELRQRKEILFRKDAFFRSLPAAFQERLVDASVADQTCMETYPFAPYPGRVTLFRATRPLELDPETVAAERRHLVDDFVAAVHTDATNGWRNHVEDLRVVELDTTHRLILKDEALEHIVEILTINLVER